MSEIPAAHGISYGQPHQVGLPPGEAAEMQHAETGRQRAQEIADEIRTRAAWAAEQVARCTCLTALRAGPAGHAGDCPLAEALHQPGTAVPVTAATIRAAIFEPLGLPGDQLPAWGTPLEEDSCLYCLLPARMEGGDLCLYCRRLAQLNAELAAPGIGAELRRRRETCSHGKRGSFFRDGRCRRCGIAEADASRRRAGWAMVIALAVGIAAWLAVAVAVTGLIPS